MLLHTKKESSWTGNPDMAAKMASISISFLGRVSSISSRPMALHLLNSDLIDGGMNWSREKSSSELISTS